MDKFRSLWPTLSQGSRQCGVGSGELEEPWRMLKGIYYYFIGTKINGSAIKMESRISHILSRRTSLICAGQQTQSQNPRPVAALGCVRVRSDANDDEDKRCCRRRGSSQSEKNEKQRNHAPTRQTTYFITMGGGTS